MKAGIEKIGLDFERIDRDWSLAMLFYLHGGDLEWSFILFVLIFFVLLPISIVIFLVVSIYKSVKESKNEKLNRKNE